MIGGGKRNRYRGRERKYNRKLDILERSKYTNRDNSRHSIYIYICVCVCVRLFKWLY